MTRANEYRAYFTLVGEFDHKEITDCLGLEPSDAWNKGERNERTHFERKFSRWSLNSRLPDSEPIVSQMRDVLQQLVPYAEKVRELRAKYVGYMQVVAYFHSDTPWFHFDEDVITDCASMNLAIDCDFYTMYSDRRDDS